VGRRAGLDDVEKGKFMIIPGFEHRPFDRPARRQSLCRLPLPFIVFLKYEMTNPCGSVAVNGFMRSSGQVWYVIWLPRNIL
jgi:hypothetical protein